ACMPPAARCPPLFPYTTLFRSIADGHATGLVAELGFQLLGRERLLFQFLRGGGAPGEQHDASEPASGHSRLLLSRGLGFGERAPRLIYIAGVRVSRDHFLPPDPQAFLAAEPPTGRAVVIAPTPAASETIELALGLDIDTLLEREHGDDIP